MRFLDCSWVVRGVAAVTSAAECAPLTEAALNKVIKPLIFEYWAVVVTASWSRAAPLLVESEARFPKCASNCDLISSEEKGMADYKPVGG